MALYEAVFIARQDLTPEDVDSLVNKFSKIITDGSGKIISTEYWGLRNLAYVINKNSQGRWQSGQPESYGGNLGSSPNPSMSAYVTPRCSSRR